ncbi:hypothetical protein [Synergistes jonesii]|uniref:hypothetical protein n=1 Tax=Synergistes jonesii TaxID=2754 RepID=UPI00248EAD72|nr:hypothetical protein [Synergistes jonesii]
MKELNAIIGKYRIKARNQLKREYPELAPKSIWRYNPSQPETDLQWQISRQMIISFSRDDNFSQCG